MKTSNQIAEVERTTNGQLHLNGFDYLELYVGNAKQAAHFFCTAFGFQPIAYTGLETGIRDRVSFVVEQRGVHLVLTSPLTPESQVAAHVLQHGDGVKDIAFNVSDAIGAFEMAVSRGATPILEPTRCEDETGCLTKATIAVYGSTVHSFIQREGESKAFLPRFLSLSGGATASASGLGTIDHIAISLEPGNLDEWIEFYEAVLGFHQSHQEDVATEYSAMHSKVVQNDTGTVIFPMMEPAQGKRKSQVEEYLNFHRGPGAQHIALTSDNIIQSVRALRHNKIGVLQTPKSYYETLEERIGHLDADLSGLSELSILVDRDGWGYLMQVFTEPVQSRPTLFFEIIQRYGARGFGGGNIKALFEAVEREQARRGTLS
jgi:4-hydroxyphenylpyruvate dioxygenase